MHKSELQAQDKSQKNKLCAWRHNMPCPARCTHAVAHLQSIAYTPVAPSAPCATNIHDRQAAARFGQWRRNWSWRYIYYVVTWTANQSGLVTLTFDLLTLKVASESRVMWVTYVLILVFLGLSDFELGPMYATDRQSSDKSIAYCPRLLDIITQKELFDTEWSCLCCSRDVCIIDSDTEIIRFIFTGNLKNVNTELKKFFLWADGLAGF